MVTAPFTFESLNQRPESTLPRHVQTSTSRPRPVCAGDVTGVAMAAAASIPTKASLIVSFPGVAAVTALKFYLSAERLRDDPGPAVADLELDVAGRASRAGRLKCHRKIAVDPAAERLEHYVRSNVSRKRQPQRAGVRLELIRTGRVESASVGDSAAYGPPANVLRACAGDSDSAAHRFALDIAGDVGHFHTAANRGCADVTRNL